MNQLDKSFLQDQVVTRSQTGILQWQIVIGFVLGLIFFVAAVSQVNLSELWAGLGRSRLEWVGLALLSVLLNTVARVERWRRLFPDSQPGFWVSCRALLAGQLINALLPARVGDLSRVYQFGVESGRSKATTLGTIAAEKGFDTLFLLLAIGLSAVFNPFLPSWLNLSLFSVTTIGLLSIIIALAWPQQRTLLWAKRFVYRIPRGLGIRIWSIFERTLDGLASLRTWQLALSACFWSALVWLLYILNNYLLFKAFDLDLSLGVALLLLVVLLIGSAPPSTPARLGVFHGLTMFTLEFFGVDRPIGLAYATVLHFIVYLPQIILGTLFVGTHFYVGWRHENRHV